MAANGTKNYSLSQWEANDRVLREDFNADNATIDAALWGLAQETARLGVEKADASALAAEAQARTGLSAQVAKLGNCTIWQTSYVGDGAATKTLTFPKAPLVVFIMGSSIFMRAIRGVNETISNSPGGVGAGCQAKWSGASLTWTYAGENYNRAHGCNYEGLTYQVVALMDAGE